MSPTPYQRKQGDFELRILSDGRLVLVAPDETLLEIAQTLAEDSKAQPQQPENPHAEAAAPGGQ
jgi:hypothetical protein